MSIEEMDFFVGGFGDLRMFGEQIIEIGRATSLGADDEKARRHSCDAR